MSKILKTGGIFKSTSIGRDVVGVAINDKKAYLFTQYGESYSQGEGLIPEDVTRIHMNDSCLIEHPDLRLAIAAIQDLVLSIDW